MGQPQPARDPAFRAYLKVQKEWDAQLVRVLESSARDIQRRIRILKTSDTISARVREAQLRLTLDAIHKEIASMWRPGVTDVVLQGSAAAAKAAEIAVETISRVAYASLPGDASQALLEGLRASSSAGIDARYARVPRELSSRVFRDRALTNGTIDRLIQQGLVQQLSARELAASVYQFVSPTTPGGASYAASRLARTEINNAFHEQQQKVGELPGVKGIKWNLSSSHPKPDVCNQYADSDHANMGPGVFRVGDVPAKPHPHCFCFLTYVTMDPKQFAAELQRGTFDDELRRRISANQLRLAKGEA